MVSPTGTTFNYAGKVAAGNYRYQIGVVDRDGEYIVRDSGREREGLWPRRWAQNEPNPFNPGGPPFVTR